MADPVALMLCQAYKSPHAAGVCSQILVPKLRGTLPPGRTFRPGTVCTSCAISDCTRPRSLTRCRLASTTFAAAVLAAEGLAGAGVAVAGAAPFSLAAAVAAGAVRPVVAGAAALACTYDRIVISDYDVIAAIYANC